MKLVVALVIAWTSVAHADIWTITVPPGYTELPADQLGQATKQLEGKKRLLSVHERAFASPTFDVQLIVFEMTFSYQKTPTRRGLQAFEDELLGDADRSDLKPIAAWQRFEGDQLVAGLLQIDGDSRLVHFRRYAADKSHVVHLIWLICSGPTAKLGACEKAQQSLTLSPPAPAKLEATTASRIGPLVVGAVCVAFIIVLVWLDRRRRRKRHAARVNAAQSSARA